MMQLQELTGIVGATVAVGAAIYSVSQSRLQHRREDFELARSLHADLTTGLVADARDALGTVAFGKASEHQLLETQDIRRSYFVLLWCFERILSGRQSMQSRSKMRPNPAVEFLDNLIRWHVGSWFTSFPVVQIELEKRTKSMVDDKQSRAAYEELFLQLFSIASVAKFKAVGLTPPSDLAERVERLKASDRPWQANETPRGYRLLARKRLQQAFAQTAPGPAASLPLRQSPGFGRPWD